MADLDKKNDFFCKKNNLDQQGCLIFFPFLGGGGEGGWR